MANSADPDHLASEEAVCKGRVYMGSAGQGLIICFHFHQEKYLGQFLESVSSFSGHSDRHFIANER